MVPVGTRYKLRDARRFQATNTTGACAYKRGSPTKQLEKGRSVHIGSKYQVRVPRTVPSDLPPADSTPDRAVQVWSPRGGISDSELNDYASFAAELYGYNEEQALGVLQWHGHDLDKAASELGNFVPVVDKWTAEDDARFENALVVHSKNFRVIQRMFPKKTIASLVKHYYLWKQTRTYTSLLDHRVLRPTTAPRDSWLSESGKTQGTRIRKGGTYCGRILERVGGDSEKNGSFQRDPERALTTTKKDRYQQRSGCLKRKDIVQLTQGFPYVFEATMQAMDREIANMRKQVQKNKQDLSRMKHMYSRSIDVVHHLLNNSM